ncbi:MAG: hypothetical protein H7232_12145 [Aeromicrobium sp.]|nr:hypothetical protein [Burkholderiales bacterium]
MSQSDANPIPEWLWNDDTQYDTQFLINAFLAIETKELLEGKVSYGDGGVTSKARRVLSVGSRQILQGEIPSPHFLKYVALCMKNSLEESNGSLDKAFNLVKRPGRPKRDPQDDDHIIDAFLGEICLLGKAPKGLSARAFNAAFKAMHGKSVEDFRLAKIDEKSIDNRLTATRTLLKNRGYY